MPAIIQRTRLPTQIASTLLEFELASSKLVTGLIQFSFEKFKKAGVWTLLLTCNVDILALLLQKGNESPLSMKQPTVRSSNMLIAAVDNMFPEMLAHSTNDKFVVHTARACAVVGAGNVK